MVLSISSRKFACCISGQNSTNHIGVNAHQVRSLEQYPQAILRKMVQLAVLNGNLLVFNAFVLQMLLSIPIKMVETGVKVVAGQMGKFPRAKELRNKAGLDLSTLVSRLGAEGPKERSIRKLEEGDAIRLAGVYRVGHVLNSSLKERGVLTVDLDKEIIPI